MRNPFQSLIENQVASFHAGLTSAMEELARTEVEGSAGAGAVKIQMTGAGEVRRVSLDPSLLAEPDAELLEDLVCTAMRDVLERVAALKKEKIMSSTPLAGLGVDLPDIF
jgi:DNA-binding YbaB/EbfC family protein